MPNSLRAYQPRQITFLGRHDEVPGWRVKLYGIAAGRPAPRPELVSATVAALAPCLPDNLGPPSFAFAIAHDAADLSFALINWFVGGNEIHQRMLSAPLDAPSALAEHRSAAIGCVWELAVVDFERRAWLEHVLTRPHNPGYASYLGVHLEETV
jgi:hypothetical protein